MSAVPPGTVFGTPAPDEHPQAGGSPAGLPATGPRAGNGAPPAAKADPRQLSPEEQMALFEKDLKENDWGHQPC